MNLRASISLAIQGLMPLSAFIFFTHEVIAWNMVVFVPCFVMYFLYMMIWKRIHGYTGDCCGALFLIIELSVYLTVAILWYNAMKATAMSGTGLINMFNI